MKYLFAGGQTEERLNLLLSLTKISSEAVLAALHDHLVKGFSISDAATINSTAQQNVDRALSKLEKVADMVEKIKEHDYRKVII